MSKSALKPSIVRALRAESPVVVPLSQDFRRRSFLALVRASRAVSAHHRKDLSTTLRRLDDLFAYLTAHFREQPTPEDARNALSTGRTTVVSEAAFPVLLSRFVLQMIRLDMSDVPSFADWARSMQEPLLSKA